MTVSSRGRAAQGMYRLRSMSRFVVCRREEQRRTLSRDRLFVVGDGRERRVDLETCSEGGKEV